MSRIGKQTITVPSGVEVKHDQATNVINVKGKLGELSETFLPFVSFDIADTEINVNVEDESVKFQKAMWGTSRANLANMIIGVSEGFSKVLTLDGVGYKMALQGDKLILNIGFSHQVEVAVPAEIKLELDKNTLKGTSLNKQMIGEFFTKVHDMKPCEPYKHKGFKFPDRYYPKKVGKKAGAKDD